MSTLPMMPKATAVWLVDNTTLTFDQVAEFCGLHPLEVQAIADGEVAVGMAGLDPVANDQLTAEEIARCEKDPKGKLTLLKSDMPMPTPRAKGARYTPVSKRQDKPDGIAWLLRTFPELSDAQIGKLLGTTKPTITAIRERTHWNAPNIRPRDPVDLGLCARGELDEAVQKARRRATRRAKDAARAARKAGLDVEDVPRDVAAADAGAPGATTELPAGPLLGSPHAPAEPAPEPEPALAPTGPSEAERPRGPAPTAANLFKTPERAPTPAADDDGPDNPVLDPNLLFKPKPAAPESEGEAADDTAKAEDGDEKGGA